MSTLGEQISINASNNCDDHVEALKLESLIEEDFEDVFIDAMDAVKDANKYSALETVEYRPIKEALAAFEKDGKDKEGNENTTSLLMLLRALQKEEQGVLTKGITDMINDDEICKDILKSFGSPTDLDLGQFQKVVTEICDAKTLVPMTKEFAKAFMFYTKKVEKDSNEENENAQAMIDSLNDLGKTRAAVKTVLGTLIGWAEKKLS